MYQIHFVHWALFSQKRSSVYDLFNMFLKISVWNSNYISTQRFRSKNMIKVLIQKNPANYLFFPKNTNSILFFRKYKIYVKVNTFPTGSGINHISERGP